MSAVVEALGLVKRYRVDGAEVRAVDGVDLMVEAGEAVSVMGPSGCGKSTLLHLLGGLERPDAVGVIPWQVTAVLLLENLGLAVAATGVGLGAGTRLSPLLTRSSTTLFGAPAAPPSSLARGAAVGGVAVAVVALATVRPALRGARRSTLRSLAATVRPPRRASRLAASAAPSACRCPACWACGRPCAAPAAPS